MELSERTFNFCAYAREHFASGDLHAKKEIFSSIGSNLTLKDGKLLIDLLHPYLLIEKELAGVKSGAVWLEPIKRVENKREKAVLATSSPSWLPG